MALFRKGTLLIPTGPVKHLHIVMNDPVFSPLHSKDCVLVVNISSINEDGLYDNTCILNVGDHPFIKWPSYVRYKDAAILAAPRLTDRISLGEINTMSPVDETVYSDVLAGFDISKNVAFKIKRFIKLHIKN